jgi:hypothetical protein
MALSVERGRWLVLTGIIAFLVLDIALFVLGWALLGRVQLVDHVIRMASWLAVGFFLYRGYVWARWFVILSCAGAGVVGVAGVVLSDTIRDVSNPFSLIFLLAVLAAAVLAVLLILSADVKAFLTSQRDRRRTSS